MPTYHVIVQTVYGGEQSVTVEAQNRGEAYSAAARATGGYAVDSCQLFSPAERAANRAEIERERAEWNDIATANDAAIVEAMQPFSKGESFWVKIGRYGR